MTYSEYAAPLYEVQRVHNRIQSKINELKDYVAYVLEQPIDNTLRDQMNSDYYTLDYLSKQLNSYGVSRELNSAINELERSINSHINSYNNRVEEYQKQQKNNYYQSSTVQEPKNNLGKTYLSLSREWPGLSFLQKTEDGYNVYGTGEDGNFFVFYFKNEILKKECVIVESRDGFARQFYDSMRNSFYNSKNYKSVDWGEYMTTFYYSYFQIELFYYYYAKDGTTGCSMEYKYLNQ